MTLDKFSEVVMNASSEICMEDLTKAAMWRAAAIFRFRIQKINWGMILILQVLLSITLAASATDFKTLQVNFKDYTALYVFFWPYYPANLSVFSKRYEWSYTNTMRRGQIVDWSMFCCSRWHSVQPAPLSSQPSSEEQLLLLGQGLTSRPADGGGGGRGRSVSFSLPSSARSAPPASPPSWQEHASTSEAGSSTLKQVLPMSRHSPGTPSPADTGYGS